MARHRATRSSIASMVSTTSTNGTRSRTKLSYEQNALLALAENSLKKNKKPLNISAIVKSAERRAQEQGLALGVRARPSIKKAVEKLSEQGAITEAPRKGRAPAEYKLTPKATKVYNDAKAHRRSEVGIAKETLETLKGNVERPTKRRRSSVSTTVASPRSTQNATIDKLKAELAAARSEIVSLKKSNYDLLDQQLDDDDDDDDIFGSPTRKATAYKQTELPARPPLAGVHSVSFLGNRPTRPTTPEPTEHGSPEYDAPGEFDYSLDMNREMTPPSSAPPEAIAARRMQEEPAIPEKSEMELKMERLEASMSELVLEKARMAEEITTLKNQVQHERQNVTRLTQVEHEADLVRVELAQVTNDRDLALKDISLLSQENAALDFAKEQLEIAASQLRADLEVRTAAEADTQASLVNAVQELEATKFSLVLSQDESHRLSESFAMADNTAALLKGNLAARESTIAELQSTNDLTSKQLQTLQSRGQTLRSDLAVAQNLVLGAEATAAEHESQIAGLKAEQEALRGTVVGLKGQKSELVREKDALVARVKALELTTDDNRAQILSLGGKMEELNAQAAQLEQALEASQLERAQLIVEANADKVAAGRSIAQRDATIAGRDIQLTKLGLDLEVQATELLERQKRIGQLDEALVQSTKAIKSLESAKKSTETKLYASVNAAEGLNKMIASLQEKDRASMKRIGQLQADLVQHKDALEEHQDAISKLELQLDRLRSIELESLRRRRARIEAEAKRLRDEEADLTRETIDVDQWDEGLTQSRAARSSLAPSWGVPSSP